jgi:hypothetical protein
LKPLVDFVMSINDKLILSIELSETERTRHYWLAKFHQKSVVAAADDEASILLAPWEQFRDGKDLFPQGTSDFFKFIQAKRPDVPVAIAVSEDEYREITLHGNEFRLPTALIKETLVAVFVGLCAEYLMHNQAHPTKDIVQLEVIVEGPSRKCISVKYKGPPGKLADRILEEIDRCLPGAAKDGKQTKHSKEVVPVTKPSKKKPSIHD